MTDLTEDDIELAIDRCDEGIADPAERSIAAAAMVRQAYAYAGLPPRSFSSWLRAIAKEFEHESGAGAH